MAILKSFPDGKMPVISDLLEIKRNNKLNIPAIRISSFVDILVSYPLVVSDFKLKYFSS